MITIPSAAIEQAGRRGPASVRVVGADGKPEKRPVKVGINNNVNAEILEGLAEGEKVVLSEAPAPGSQNAPRQAPRMRF